MSIFGSIMAGIFDRAASAASPGPEAKPANAAQASAPAARPAAASAQIEPSAAPQSSSSAKAPVDVTAIMDKLTSQAKEKLDWRKSIVDLMKLLDLDSSIAARKQLAQELHYPGNVNDSASMNVWLHKQVMIKLAEHGGKVPELFATQKSAAGPNAHSQ